METVLKGTKSVVHIAPNKPTVVIGQRVSPNRRKRPVDGSGADHIDIAKNEILAQVSAGADVVDVDVDVPFAEQVDLLPRLVETAQQAVEVPLSINTPHPAALAAALKVYQGKPLVNGVSGAKKSLSQILPLVARYGAAVIGLCRDENGLPDDPYQRLEIAGNIVEQAEGLGIPREDVLINCLTSPVETNPQAALLTLETIRLVRTELGVNLTLNIGDISAELPKPGTLHQAFLTAAILEGVNAPVVEVSPARQNILAVDVLLGQDERMLRYIQYYHFRRSGMRSLVDWELVG
ncbi:MAG: dihydropteroate synthase [Anaerolineae bacterium]|nr:dihydropteroate synthase [Anaerolineae bacterium]